MINSYYAVQDGKEVGPFTREQLIEQGISADTLVLSPLSEHWQSAGELPELTQYFQEAGIYLPYRAILANFWWRLLAFLIDTAIVYAFLIVAVVFIDVVLPLIGKSPLNFDDNNTSNAITLTYVLVVVFYFPLMESSRTQATIGKIACGLKVVDENGMRISFLKAIGRYLGKILSSLICYAGFLVVLFSDNRQAWHDQLAKTYVLRPANN